jgi:hypothetical protein
MEMKPMDDLIHLELGKLMRQIQQLVEAQCEGPCGVVLVAKKADTPEDGALIISDLQPQETAIILHGALGIIQLMLFNANEGLVKERELKLEVKLEVSDEPPEDGPTTVQ